jgi:hypothetical protein
MKAYLSPTALGHQQTTRRKEESNIFGSKRQSSIPTPPLDHLFYPFLELVYRNKEGQEERRLLPRGVWHLHGVNQGGNGFYLYLSPSFSCLAAEGANGQKGETNGRTPCEATRLVEQRKVAVDENIRRE